MSSFSIFQSNISNTKNGKPKAMKILFISSGNNGISPIIRAQGESLSKAGIQIDYFPIVGKGFFGYLKNLPSLRMNIIKVQPDVIHAHYSLCGIVAALAKIFVSKKQKKPLVVSLMGSDVKSADIWLSIIRFFVKYAWDKCIVKSDDMKRCLGIDSAYVIPNGVDADIFKPLDQKQCRARLGWDQSKKYVLFGADPSREVKNFPLAKKAFTQLATDDVQLCTLSKVPHSEIPCYLNACDVLLLTSKWEGSPNIIKESMACNTPIVCTDVGDVKWLFDGVNGCYVSMHDPDDIAAKLKLALVCSKKTTGRMRLMELGLDAKSVAKRIVNVYRFIYLAKSQ